MTHVVVIVDKTFSWQQGEKSYYRRSLESSGVVNTLTRKLAALEEEEVNVTLTPNQKQQRCLAQNVHGLLFLWQNRHQQGESRSRQ